MVQLDQRKLVVVLGATGQQGGSVIEAFLKEPEKYQIRGVTRNLTSEKASSLTNLGVEMVRGELNDVESLQRAFDGANIIYAMTDFWQEMSFDVEFNQGKSMADIAANLPTLTHYLWATLPDGKAISEGKFSNIFHWQSKAAVTDYIRQNQPSLWRKTTAILFPNYFENCKTAPRHYLPVKQSDGVYVRSFPLAADTPLPNVAISDTGKLVRYVVEHGADFSERTVAFYSQALSEGEKLDTLAKFHDIPVRYEQISERQFRDALEENMPPIAAQDFTEQLMIFEACGMIYASAEFLQANQIKGLEWTTWDEYVASANLLEVVATA